jgi:hypothetical protein
MGLDLDSSSPPSAKLASLLEFFGSREFSVCETDYLNIPDKKMPFHLIEAHNVPMPTDVYKHSDESQITHPLISPTMKTRTSEQIISILLTVITLTPDHGVRYTALGLLFAAVILCKVHLQFPSMQLRQLAVSLNQTEEYIQEATLEAP